MVFSLFAPFVAPLVLVVSVILYRCRPGFPRSVFLQRRLSFDLRRFSFRLVVSFVVLVSCCFSFRLSCRVSWRCVVGLLVRAGGRGARKLRLAVPPTASTLSVFYPPALVGCFEAWGLLWLVVVVRRVFFFAVVGRCTAICGGGFLVAGVSGAGCLLWGVVRRLVASGGVSCGVLCGVSVVVVLWGV